VTAAVAILCAAILTFASGFHFYWGFGGQTGVRLSLPQREDGTPIAAYGAIGALAVAVVLAMVMVLLLALAGLIRLPLPIALIRAAVAAWALLFAARALSWWRYAGLFKSVRNTDFAHYDTRLYSPLCLLLGVGLGYVALAV
jgi:hypothetical protein